jgi:heat shock protein HslJ
MKGWVCLLVLFFFCDIKSQNLAGTRWLLSSIDDIETGVSKDIGATVKATLNFDTDTSYSGKFCNQFSGRYKHNKEQSIKLGIPVSTKMLCMGIDKYEKEMFSLFTTAHKYRVDKEVLFIFSTHKRLTFKKENPVKASR